MVVIKSIGISVELSAPMNWNPDEPISLEDRARENGYGILKQLLIDALLSIITTGEFVYFNPSLPLLRIRIPQCGHSVIYRSLDKIPEEDTPCSCGDPNHWFIQYRDKRDD